MKKHILKFWWILPLVGLIWAIWAISDHNSLPMDQFTQLRLDAINPTENAKIVSATNQSLDQSRAPLLIIYSDYQCPACKRMETIVDQALDEISMTGEVRIVYRDFPLRNIHRNAQSSSQAAQAAALQGKFWEMHERIFERVSEWENAANPQPIFEMYAQELGLDVKKFSQDYQSKFVRAKVEHEYQSGLLYRVGATPTVFLAGKKVTFATSEELVKLIQKNE